jgi:hypothetical protein
MPMNFSAAGQALGFGRTGVAPVDMNGGGLGDALQRQVGDETEEQRKRRMLGLLPTQSGASIPGASSASRALFGPMAGGFR